jgi:hypothetical protein
LERTADALAIRRVPLSELHEDLSNARAHGPENLDAIAASLARWGQAEPLVVQAGSRRVIGGNGRLAAMRKLGWTECDVVELSRIQRHVVGGDVVWVRADEIRVGDYYLVGEEDADGKIIEDASGHIRLYRSRLPEIVQELHEYWIAWRRGRAPISELGSGKVGRNDPCPCGSGRKYKKCCGSKPAESV